MERLYRYLNISRQALHKHRASNQVRGAKEEEVRDFLEKHRKNHREDGSRQSYYSGGAKELLGIGVTKFEKTVSLLGLTQKITRRWKGTSERCSRSKAYKNLTNGLKLNGVNQLISGDIFYYTGKIRYYVFVLTDVYSGRIVGLSGGTRMTAMMCLDALKQFFELRGAKKYLNTIHLTDGGPQFFSNMYLNAMEKAEMLISVAGNCRENGYAEQKNATVKNRYLRYLNTSNNRAFQKSLVRVKYLVNCERKMKSNGWMTPDAFERKISALKLEDRPVKQLHDFQNNSPTS